MIRKEKIICVLGGGNIGTLLLADLSKNENITTILYTSRPEQWKREIRVLEPNGDLEFTGRVDVVSNDPKATIALADIVISTLPANILQQSLPTILNHIKKDAAIGFIPGSGGKEFLFKDFIEKGHTLFGFQRVHGISRINNYGESVFDLGRKEEIFIGTIPSSRADDFSSLFEKLLNVKCIALPNYLAVTLVPSNPILHTSRLYSLFKNYLENKKWENEVLFYKEWDDDSSKILIECDRELQLMLRKIKGLDTSFIKSLKNHYGVDNYREMTIKISSIPAFSGIKAPMIKTENGYLPDFESRYFKEDFPYGLCVIRSFANILSCKTPNIDILLRWYEKKYSLNFYRESEFCGKSLTTLPLPQNYGILNLTDIINFYK